MSRVINPVASSIGVQLATQTRAQMASTFQRLINNLRLLSLVVIELVTIRCHYLINTYEYLPVWRYD